MRFYDVDMEDPTDPYGEGIGFTIVVRAKSVEEARKKANKAWPTHCMNQPPSWSYFKAYRVCPNQNIVL